MTQSDAQLLASARKKLEAERERLTRLHDGVVEESATGTEPAAEGEELTVIDQHPADAGSDVFERQKDISIAEQFGSELAEVEDALGRVEDGTYGTCEICGRPIGKERLEAIPQARLCVEDQAKAEIA